MELIYYAIVGLSIVGLVVIVAQALDILAALIESKDKDGNEP